MRMNWQVKKLRASAMQFAILVSVIVALLLGSFLLLTHTHRSFSVRSGQVLQNIELANEGINYGSSQEINVAEPLEIFINDLPVTLKKSYWGGFEMLTSMAGIGGKAFTKTALLGSNPETPRGIYLEDNKLPLVLVGKTRIEGNAYLPENIVKPGSISGHYYEGKELIYGRRFSSRENLPDLDTEWRTYIKDMLEFLPSQKENLIGLEDAGNSFSEERKIIFQTGKIYLEQVVKGNIIIKSQSEIEVSSLAELDQVLLIAPKVVFKENFEGNVHVIAEEVEVEKNSSLSYPSSIVVLEKNSRPEDTPPFILPKVIIGENTIFQGNIVYLEAFKNKITKTDILFKENSFIEGMVYSEGHSELEGVVSGSFYTRFFVANKAGSIYINHIYNGKILTEGIKPQTCGLLLEGHKKKVALWLY